MPSISEPGLLIAATIDEVIDRISKAQPIRSDGNGLTTGFVVSRLPMGMMVDPDDFRGPWTPAGGAALQDMVKAYNERTNPGSTGPTPTDAAAAAAAAAAKVADPKFRRSLQAAFNTSLLVDTMIKMSTDQSYTGYPTERKVSFNYEVLIGSMTAKPAPPIPAETQQRLDAATKVLYVIDDDGMVKRSPAYGRYIKAATAYAEAQDEFGRAFAQFGNTADWPLVSHSLDLAVRNARDEWREAGMEKVEAALDTIGAIGVPMQEKMIKKAKDMWIEYQLNLTGIAAKSAYALLFPSSWADPDSEDDGWTKLKLSAGEYNSRASTIANSSYWSNWQNSGSSSSGGGGGMIFGFGFMGSGGSRSYASSADAGASGWRAHTFQNDSRNLSIELEYGVVTINRPWLTSDLFYFRDWYNRGQRKLAISDGTSNPNTNSNRILPMLPKQFLVVRNLKVYLDQSSSDAQYFQSAYRTAHSDAGGEGSYVSGSAGLCLGPVAIGGSARRSQFSNHASSSGSSGFEARENYGFRYQNGALEQRGAQIVAWFSEVVPACASDDDPGL